MRRTVKITISILSFFIIVGVIVYIYLYVDTYTYPVYHDEGLHSFKSSNIPIGHSLISTDSLSKNIKTDGVWFKDATGRMMTLRGINVGGSTKMPYAPALPSHIKKGFFESARKVSFAGRPFPLKEADQHFSRLKRWGFQFVRLLVTWEGIEHEGPGIYDQAYLDYIYQISKKAQQYNINIFIDPHQDVWSRFTGGDGAPLWTLEIVGFDPTHFTETGAAIVHNIHGDPFPKMIWPTNYSKLGAATMFTLFFGGKDFAPNIKVDNSNIQDYLQNHYINAICQLAMKLKDLPNVIGFDSLNEPSAGYIGINDLDTLGLLRLGAMPTYFQGMIAGDGNSINVSLYEFDWGLKEIGKKQINRLHTKAWNEGAPDIWKAHGVWAYRGNKPILQKKNYFSQVNGNPVNFSLDYWKPFALKYAKAIHAIDNRWLIFAEPALFTKLPKMTPEESKNFVNAGHWYDGMTLITKKNMNVISVDIEKASAIFGKKNIRLYFANYLGQQKKETSKSLGNHPTLIGEFGIPFDMNDGHAFKSGNFYDQEDAMDRSFNALEANLLPYTLWNYTADNDNIHGDLWNGEDLSIFSISQQKNKTDINSGGRALKVVIRPYPYKVSGTPIQSFFNREKQEFYLKFQSDLSIHAPTEIFIPRYHYEKGYNVLITNGLLQYDRENDLLLYFPKGEGEHTVIVRKFE